MKTKTPIDDAVPDAMMGLDEVERLANRALERTFMVGSVLSPCSLPQTSMSLMALYVLERRMKRRLDARGIAFPRSWVVAFCTALEMAGASITLPWLDDELAPLLGRPADGAQFRV